MSFEIRSPTFEEARRLFKTRLHMVVWSKVLVRDGVVIASGGIADDDWITHSWVRHGWLMWAFLMVHETPTKAETVAMVKAMRGGLKDFGGDIYSRCDTAFPSASKMIRLCGFKPLDTAIGGMEVYKWN